MILQPLLVKFKEKSKFKELKKKYADCGNFEKLER